MQVLGAMTPTPLVPGPGTDVPATLPPGTPSRKIDRELIMLLQAHPI